MFSLLDKDGSGDISFQEVEAIVERLNAEGEGSQPQLNAQLIWDVLDQVLIVNNYVVYIRYFSHHALLRLWMPTKDRSGTVSLNEFAEGSRAARS
jgi:hypothetical protein